MTAPLCKDCRFRKRWLLSDPIWWKCTAPETMTGEISPLTGRTKLTYPDCTANRHKYDGLCGPTGKLFQPRRG